MLKKSLVANKNVTKLFSKGKEEGGESECERVSERVFKVKK